MFRRSAGRVSAQSVCVLVQLDAVLFRWSRSLGAHDGRRAGRPAVQHHQPAAGLAHVVRNIVLFKYLVIVSMNIVFISHQSEGNAVPFTRTLKSNERQNIQTHRNEN